MASAGRATEQMTKAVEKHAESAVDDAPWVLDTLWNPPSPVEPLRGADNSFKRRRGSGVWGSVSNTPPIR